MKTNSKKKVRKVRTKDDIAKLKRENHKLKEENKMLRSILNRENTGISGKAKGYSTRYSREVD